MKKIIVGILPSYIEGEGVYSNYYKFIDLYSKKIIENGAVPVGILLNGDQLDYCSLEMCDCFIIPGGNKVRGYVYETIYYAIKKNKPLIGICMGAEALDIFSVVYEKIKDCFKSIDDFRNIYLSLKDNNDGTLLKALPDGNIHDNNIVSINKINDIYHEVLVDEDSLAYKIFGPRIEVPSMHGYDFKYVGKDFKVTGKASDGVCEIIEYNNPEYFIIGFHFHVELMDSEVFKHFIEEAKVRRMKIS